MWRGRKLDDDRIALFHGSAYANDRHHPCFPDQFVIRPPIENSSKQTWLEALYLTARIAQAGYLQNDMAPDCQFRSTRQGKQVDARRRDILAKSGRINIETLRIQFRQ